MYENYPVKATPPFVAKNNLNVLLKYFIDAIQTNVGISYAYSSGRPYYNPNSDGFMNDYTPDYHDLSLTLSYLTKMNKWFMVVYAGLDNITNRKNIFGYRYSFDGTQRYPVLPATYRWIFAGVSISLQAFSKDEL